MAQHAKPGLAKRGGVLFFKGSPQMVFLPRKKGGANFPKKTHPSSLANCGDPHFCFKDPLFNNVGAHTLCRHIQVLCGAENAHAHSRMDRNDCLSIVKKDHITGRTKSCTTLKPCKAVGRWYLGNIIPGFLRCCKVAQTRPTIRSFNFPGANLLALCLWSNSLASSTFNPKPNRCTVLGISAMTKASG